MGNKKVNNTVIGNNNKITIDQSSKKTINKYPEGSIGAYNLKANYLGHLVKRYNEYKENEVGKAKMNYAMMNTHLKKKYKISPTRTIYNIPVEKFEDVVTYLQSRIDSTTLAKRMGSQHKNYSTFEEYINQ